MADEIEQSLQHLSEDDARAMVRYLKTLPERPGGGRYAPSGGTEHTPAQGNRTGDVPSVGAAVYRGFCVQCHQADGAGMPQRFPRLAGNPSVLSEDPSSLIRIVVEGGRSPATTGGPAMQHMPGFAGTLTDVQMAQVLSHVRGAWGNDARPVTTSDVARLRKAIGK